MSFQNVCSSINIDCFSWPKLRNKYSLATSQCNALTIFHVLRASVFPLRWLLVAVKYSVQFTLTTWKLTKRKCKKNHEWITHSVREVSHCYVISSYKESLLLPLIMTTIGHTFSLLFNTEKWHPTDDQSCSSAFLCSAWGIHLPKGGEKPIPKCVVLLRIRQIMKWSLDQVCQMPPPQKAFGKAWLLSFYCLGRLVDWFIVVFIASCCLLVPPPRETMFRNG